MITGIKDYWIIEKCNVFNKFPKFIKFARNLLRHVQKKILI